MTNDDDLIRRGDALKALLDGQLRALERKRLDTPDELRSAIAALPDVTPQPVGMNCREW